MRVLRYGSSLLLAFGFMPISSSLPPRLQVTTAAVHRVGYLGLRPIAESGRTIAALKEGLRELGAVEGRDYVLDVRVADNNPTRYSALIGELTNLRVEVIVAASTPAAVAIKNTNPRMPIVVGRGPDLVGAGLARSSDRPGGLITGIEELNAGSTAKSLRILKEVAGTATRVAVLSPAPTQDAHDLQYTEAEQAAQELGLTLRPFRISATTDFETLFLTVLKERPQALLVLGGVLPAPAIERIVQFARSERLPGLYPHELYVEHGGLLAYVMDNEAMFRHAATYVVKILHGAQPGDLPLTRWTRENVLHINLQTAKAIGMTIPPSVVERASRIIR